MAEPRARRSEAEALLRNGILMSSCFACNEGALLAVISLR